MKNLEFKTTKFKDATVYTLESATSGGTSSAMGATVAKPLGKDQIVVQSRMGQPTAPRPRNPVAKNASAAIGGGASGAHKDKKKAAKQGDMKHKNKDMSMSEDDSALQAFLSKGGTVQQLPYKKPRKADKTDYGSKHIGGGGDKMKSSRTGTAAKTQGSKVVGMAEVNNPAFARNANGMSIANDPKKCFNLGYNAAKFGKTQQDCPYKPGSSSAKNWIAGWTNGKESGPLQNSVAEGLRDRLAELQQKFAEVSADPAYLRSAERSRQDARDTQRQYWKSPEEKAAARSTEIKRDKGIAGYTTRHKAANPDMYPTPKMRPAKTTRDPNIDRSDDYTTWKQGQNEDHSTATGGWGKGPYATAGKDTSRWTGAGRDDSVREGDEYFNRLAESLNKVQEKMMPAGQKKTNRHGRAI